MATITDKIRTYISESFLADSPSAEIGDDDDLLKVLDSLQVLRMVMELEGEYSIKVDNSELTPENLGSVAKLAAYIEQKRQAASCSTATN